MGFGRFEDSDTRRISFSFWGFAQLSCRWNPQSFVKPDTPNFSPVDVSIRANEWLKQRMSSRDLSTLSTRIASVQTVSWVWMGVKCNVGLKKQVSSFFSPPFLIVASVLLCHGTCFERSPSWITTDILFAPVAPLLLRSFPSLPPTHS